MLLLVQTKKRPLPLGVIFLLYLYFPMMLNIFQIFLYGARKRLDYNKKMKHKEEDGIDQVFGICCWDYSYLDERKFVVVFQYRILNNKNIRYTSVSAVSRSLTFFTQSID